MRVPTPAGKNRRWPTNKQATKKLNKGEKKKKKKKIARAQKRKGVSSAKWKTGPQRWEDWKPLGCWGIKPEAEARFGKSKSTFGERTGRKYRPRPSYVDGHAGRRKGKYAHPAPKLKSAKGPHTDNFDVGT